MGEFVAGGGSWVAKVIAFVTEIGKLELQTVTGLGDVTEDYVFFAKYLGAAALLDLFYITLFLIGSAGTDGEGTVGKVDEHFAAVQVVGRERSRGVSLGRVGQHQYRQVVFGFECLKLFHNRNCAGDMFSAVAHTGNIVDNKHGGVDFFDLLVEPGGDIIVESFVVKGQDGVNVKLGAVKVVMETETSAILAEIARLELFGGKLEVYIEYFGVSGMSSKWSGGLAPGNTIAYLNGEDGFACIGIGK